MKLFLCRHCQDVVKLTRHTRFCECGKSWATLGHDQLYGEYNGKAVPLGFDNRSLALAVKHQPATHPLGLGFTAFVVPKQCETFKREETGDA